MLNSVVLVGRLTADPSLRYTTNGTAVASFALAVNRRFKQEGQQDVDFINIVAWKAQAENCAKYLTKGSQVAVEGRLQIRNYEASDGQRRTVAEVVANSVQFLETKKHDGNASEVSEAEIDDSDVPF